MSSPLYLDNAATSSPKAPAMRSAILRYLDDVAASAGRGAYREAAIAGEILEDCRSALARLLGAPIPERIVFTLNCTDALNLGLKGVLREGDHVVTTWMDHNSILRPLSHLEASGFVTVTRVRADRDGIVDPDDIAHAFTPKTRLVATLHASNVSGSVQDIAAIGAACRERGALFLVDAAQTAGALPIDVGTLPIDLLAFPGHKALLGPLGTGALWMSDRVDVAPLREGGTGSRSELAVQPGFLPDRLESGSHNLVGIAGLLASVEFVLEQGVDAIAAHERGLCERFAARAKAVPGVTIHGPLDPGRRVPVFSITVDGYDPLELGAHLDAAYGIKVRSGLHCAPLAHQTLGTHDTGTTRISAGCFTTLEDVDRAIDAVEEAVTSRGTSDRRCPAAPST